MTTLIVLFVVLLIGSGLLAMLMAKKKGYDGDLFFIGGLLSGPLAPWAAKTAHTYDIEEEPEHQADPTATTVTPWQNPGGTPEPAGPRFQAKEPQPAPQAAPQTTPQAAPQAVPQPIAQPTPKHTPQPAPQAAPQPAPQAVPQPISQPTPKPTPQPAPQAAPQAAPPAAVLAPPPLEAQPAPPQPVEPLAAPELQQEATAAPESQQEAPQRSQGAQALVELITSEAPQANRYSMPPAPQEVEDKKRGGLFKRKKKEEEAGTQPEVGFGVLTVPVPPGQATFGTCPHCQQESCADWYGLCVHCLEPFPVSVPYIDPNADAEPEEAEEAKSVSPPKKSIVEKLRQPIKIGR